MFLRKFLPNVVKIPLWGNRRKWGFVPINKDKCWQEWQKTYSKFYNSNQSSGIGRFVNNAGYHVLSKIDLSNKKVLEIGPGDIRHLKYWKGKPAQYIIADISEDMLKIAKKRLAEKRIEYDSFLIERNQKLKLDNSSIDIILSFYSLEHLYPLISNINELNRLLKPGGIIVGAVPAEGGLSWGLGRLLTSRRWLLKNTNIDPDKIICWEHPNFADQILDGLNKIFIKEKVVYWPFSWIPLLDFNLIIKIIYRKKAAKFD